MGAAPRPERRSGAPTRLRRRADIERVFREGFKLVDSGLVAWCAPAPADARCCRLGLSVSRRVGDAPRRNRVKRVLREAFRPVSRTQPRPFDIVLIARPGAAPDTLAAAQASLERLLRRAAQRLAQAR